MAKLHIDDFTMKINETVPGYLEITGIVIDHIDGQ